jgi:AcrR family transcriptional regulator
MREKSYKELSVSELCRKAGVSRMAFYRNYQVVNDLFRETARELNEKIILAVGSPFRRGTTVDWYEQAFHIIREHRDEVAIMFQENFQLEWMKVVNGLAVHDPAFSTEKKYQRLIWCGGFENIVAFWLNRGMRESPREMADYCIRYLPHLLADASEN